MKLKKILAAVLTAAMCVSMLAGCGSGGAEGQASEQAQSSGQAQEAASEDSGSGEPVKLTALYVKNALTKDVNEMEWLRQIEERAGVEIEWQQISADWDQKKNTLFGSGDIPDILISATTDSDYVQFDGLFEDLTPWIEEYGPNIQAMFEAHPDVKALATTMEGKIYGLPAWRPADVITRALYINQTWLDNLGLEMPTTWEELKEVLVAFKEQDANGNGDPSDEIPMDAGLIPDTRSPIYLLGSLGIPLSDNATSGYFAEDGVVKNIYVDERMKTLLEFMRDLWGEGLFNNEMFTQDYSKFQSTARGEGTTAKVGVSFGWSPSDRFGAELADQYVTVPPLKYTADQDESELTWMNCSFSMEAFANTCAVSANCSDKAAAMRFLDLFFSREFGVQVVNGGPNDIDKGLKINEDGSYTLLPPADPSLDSESWKWTNAFVNNGPSYIPEDVVIEKSETTLALIEERKVYADAVDRIEGNDYYPQMAMKYSADDTNTMAMNQTNIDNITSQQLAAWITGEGDIESEWDSFVENVNNAGMTQNLEIRQKAYDSYLQTLE